jgi:perosamine synthetase
MTCTDNDEYATKLRYLRTHGQTGKYLHTMLGLNYRMTDVEAAIGREQLKRLDDMLAIRRRNGKMLNEGLTDFPGISRQRITPNSNHAWHQYCVVVEPEAFGCDRDTLAQRLDEKGIATGVHYPRGLHQQPIFEKVYGKSHLPHTEDLAKKILALPVHHGMSPEDAQRVVEAIKISHG